MPVRYATGLMSFPDRELAQQQTARDRRADNDQEREGRYCNSSTDPHETQRNKRAQYQENEK